MNLQLLIVLQTLALFLQGLNAAMFSEKYRLLGGLLIGFGQALAAVLALYRNPDGAPATQPWVKKPGEQPPLRCLVWLLAALVLAGQAGCGDDQQARDGLREIAKASHRIGNSVDKARQAVQRLTGKGLMTEAEAQAVLTGLLDLSGVTDEFSEQARLRATFDARARADLTVWVAQLREASLRLINDGTVHIRNPTARAEISTLVQTISQAVILIGSVIETLKPAKEVSDDRRESKAVTGPAGGWHAGLGRLAGTDQLLCDAGDGMVRRRSGRDAAVA